MFTGLIQAVGKIVSVTPKGNGRVISIDISGLSETPEIGASIAVSGTCLTVTSLDGGVATFDAVEETISRTILATASAGMSVNLEPALCVGDPLDGHIVQGHVDVTAQVLSIENSSHGSRLNFELPESISHLVAEKGSIAIDGISLTVASVSGRTFSVAVIPHTLKNTTLVCLRSNGKVNLEADVLARYAARSKETDGLTEGKLRQAGFM